MLAASVLREKVTNDVLTPCQGLTSVRKPDGESFGFSLIAEGWQHSFLSRTDSLRQGLYETQKPIPNTTRCYQATKSRLGYKSEKLPLQTQKQSQWVTGDLPRSSPLHHSITYPVT